MNMRRTWPCRESAAEAELIRADLFSDAYRARVRPTWSA
jgi:hypothetical protein